MTPTSRLSFAVGVGFANVMPPAFAGALAVQIMRDLDIDHAAFGTAISAFFLLNALSSPFVGGMVDRLGMRGGVQVATGVTTACMVAVGAIVQDYPTLLVVLLLGGMGTAFGGPTGSLLLADGFTATRQPAAFGIKQASIPAASAVAGFTVPAVALSAGWRTAFLFGGAAAAGVAVSAGRLPRKARQTRTDSPIAGDRGRLWVLALAFFLAASSAMGLNSFAVDYAVGTGLTEGQGGLILGIGSVAAIATRVIAGWAIGPSARQPLGVSALLLGAGAVGYAVLATAGTGGVLVGVVLALGAGWGWTGLLTYAVTIDNSAAPAAATGIVQTGGASGGIIGPSLAGWLVGATSYAVVWGLAAVACAVAAGLMIWAGRWGATTEQPSGG